MDSVISRLFWSDMQQKFLLERKGQMSVKEENKNNG